jgi:hypothetical protein
MTAPGDEAPAAGGAAAGAPEDYESKHKDSATSGLSQLAIRADIDQHDQVVAHLKARVARAGFTLHVIGTSNGSSIFTVMRWGRMIDLVDVAAVERFLRRIGAP